MINLEGTKDSYSDSDEANENRRVKPIIAKNRMGKLAAYSSCKRLLLKVDLIIKD